MQGTSGLCHHLSWFLLKGWVCALFSNLFRRFGPYFWNSSSPLLPLSANGFPSTALAGSSMQVRDNWGCRRRRPAFLSQQHAYSTLPCSIFAGKAMAMVTPSYQWFFGCSWWRISVIEFVLFCPKLKSQCTHSEKQVVPGEKQVRKPGSMFSYTESLLISNSHSYHN